MFLSFLSFQRTRGAFLAALLLVPTPWSARAAEGVLEINQACAVQAGCFAGDSPGLPVVITSRGSYELTGNLEVSTANTTAIEVRSDGVTIDLNGFSISGVTQCSLGSCAPTGTGMGINGNSEGQRSYTTVRNGIIRGMGAFGVRCDRGCTVENMRVESNGAIGIVLSNGGGDVRENVVRNNGDGGIFAEAVISGNVVEENGGTGIFDQAHGVLSKNRVRSNLGNGVRCNRCLVVDNVIRDNGGFGLLALGEVGVARNVIVDNTAGTIDTGAGTLLELGANVCGGDTTCP